jgi:phthalate 4,5-dioxygenase reductase subunit
MDPIDVRVATRRALTTDITEFVLQPVGGGTLPAFTPGAHITVRTPSGAMRRYSLMGDGTAPETYRIAVKREPESRGGSASMHADAAEGSVLRIEPPENDFELVEAPDYLLIAGGIGVTPIYAMARGTRPPRQAVPDDLSHPQRPRTRPMPTSFRPLSAIV